MKNKYSFRIAWSREDDAYIARCRDFPSLATHGDSPLEALQELTSVIEEAEEEAGMNYLTIKQAAKKASVCLSTMNGWLHREDDPLPYFRIGKKGIRIAEPELDEWMRRFKVIPRQQVPKFVEVTRLPVRKEKAS